VSNQPIYVILKECAGWIDASTPIAWHADRATAEEEAARLSRDDPDYDFDVAEVPALTIAKT